MQAGAGRAEIDLSGDLFPTEGFISVHDPLHVRVLIIDDGTRIAFVSLELTSVHEDQINALRLLVAAVADVQPENVWVCVTHTLSAPHFVPSHLCQTPADHQKNSILIGALKTAVRAAAIRAVSELREARFGYSTGTCAVNVNRDIYTAEGWWLGCSETGPSNKSVPVLCFNSLDGQPIAILFSYDVQPSVMNSAQMTAGGLQVSSDMTGAACRFLEQTFDDNVVALFCIGAAADQAPALKANFNYAGKNRQLCAEDIHEAGYVLMEMLGKRLGIEVLRVVVTIECQPPSGRFSVETHTLEFPGQQIADMQHIRPTHTYDYLPAAERKEPVYIITLGDVVLIGVRPEISTRTAEQIKADSPYVQTMVLTMVNGGAKYMAEAQAYDRITYEAMNSFFARGSAELLTENISNLLRANRND